MSFKINMCGIAGIYNLDQKPVDPQKLRTMTQLLSHRGPDDHGYWVGNIAGRWVESKVLNEIGFPNEYNIGFGHRRLSIIDLSSAGHQPMSNEDNTLWLVVNGEIYNYKELIPELQRTGHRFKSNTDSEVILHAYEEWGEACVDRFNGMWAFAIWDIKKNRIFCSRDRFGVKPFYYYFDGKTFIFASEIKAVLSCLSERKPNNKVIYNYLVRSFGFMDIYDETFFLNIKALMPAHSMTVDQCGLKFHKYWQVSLKNNSLKLQDNIDIFKNLFIDAVKIRMRSDVKVGGALSGGIDSSSITSVIKKILNHSEYETYSACFNEKQFDERKYIEEVTKDVGYPSNYVFPRGDKMFETISKQLWYQDEPFNAMWVHSQWYIYQRAAENGTKVFLNGKGSDEILGGYYPHFYYLFAGLLSKLKFVKFAQELLAFNRRHEHRRIDFRRVFKIMASRMLPRNVKKIGRNVPPFMDARFSEDHEMHEYQFDIPTDDYLKKNLYESFFISPIPGMLHFDDRNSMAFSIESRQPFLDYRLVEHAFSIPSEHKVRDGLNKFILRKAMKNILPEKISRRYDKIGFQSAVSSWFKKEQRDTVFDLFESQSFKNRGYFDQSEVLKEFKRHVRGEIDCHEKLWSWIALELWFRRFIDTNIEGNQKSVYSNSTINERKK